MRLKHAEHNEALCDLLLKNGNFNDWVITTAFYSSLHFVQHKIFPFKQHRKLYRDLNQYYFQFIVKSKYRISKHQSMADLVKSKMPDAYNSYRWLLDSCQTARYNNYLVSEEKAIKAWERLQTIKKEVFAARSV